MVSKASVEFVAGQLYGNIFQVMLTGTPDDNFLHLLPDQF
jgi:hypothetical protein